MIDMAATTIVRTHMEVADEDDELVNNFTSKGSHSNKCQV
jgi:hypothetical protein